MSICQPSAALPDTPAYKYFLQLPVKEILQQIKSLESNIHKLTWMQLISIASYCPESKTYVALLVGFVNIKMC